jgi:hypothetical protein
MAAEDELDDLVVIDDAVSNACVKMKLNQFCTNVRLRKKLDSIAIDMNRLVAEAYLFGNFHLLRTLATPGAAIPAVGSRKFWYRCLLATSKNKCRADTIGSDFE